MWVCISDVVTVIHKCFLTAKKLKINKSTLFLSFFSKRKTNGACGPESCLLGVVFFVWYFYVGQAHRHDILVPIPNRGKQLCLPDKLT
jgi:hypothetical protein